MSNKIFSTLKMVIIPLVIMLLMGELVTRVFLGVQPYKKEIKNPPYNTAQKDVVLGWKTTPNYSFTGEMQDDRGNSYPVNLKYDENGFKAYGNVNSSKTKIFFIRDSYTQSIEVSNEKSFFNIVKDSMDVEVFAYGQAGFGTLQEYLVLKEYLPIINPDIVIWQTCSNDFIDNSYELEMLSGYKVGELRPYLDENGKMEYVRPVRTLKSLGEYASFFRFIDEKLNNFKYSSLKKHERIAEHFIDSLKHEYAPYAHSIKLTKAIMKKVKSELPPDVRLIGFAADTYDPQLNDFKIVFNDEGFEFFNKSAHLILWAQYSDQCVNSSDKYHWNEKGHRLVAEGLIEQLFP